MLVMCDTSQSKLCMTLGGFWCLNKIYLCVHKIKGSLQIIWYLGIYQGHKKICAKRKPFR